MCHAPSGLPEFCITSILLLSAFRLSNPSPKAPSLEPWLIQQVLLYYRWHLIPCCQNISEPVHPFYCGAGAGAAARLNASYAVAALDV